MRIAILSYEIFNTHFNKEKWRELIKQQLHYTFIYLTAREWKLW